MTDRDTLADAKEAFKLAEDAEADNRRLWLEDVKFARLGEQWPDKVKAQREAEGRPCLTINKMPAFIRQVTNDARQNKPSIKCHPVDDDASEEVAEILDGLIRNIEYSSNADVAYDTALESAVTGGFGYFRISTDYACDDQFDQDIKIERVVNPLNIYGDPCSTAADSSDWNSAFVTERLKTKEFTKKYPNAATSNFEADGHDQDWFTDEKVRIAEYWTREEVAKTLLKLSDGSVMYAEAYRKMYDILQVMGVTIVGERETKGYKVTQRIITGAEVLETNAWQGKYIPIIPVFGDEINVEGKRHLVSLIRGSKDAQQMFNFWRTASTELVALAPKAPFIGPKGAFNTDADKWATANNKSHAYIEYDGQMPPQRQAFAGVPAGALQEALNASDDMKSIMGIYDASLGARSNETSGRAIMARQREGDVSTFNFIDNLSRAIRHAGRVIVDLIPHVYDAPRIIRIIHEDGSNESVKINQEHQAEAPMTDGMQGQPGSPAQMQGPMGESQQKEQQEFMQGLVKLYDVTSGKYDVTCQAGPSYTTKRQESADQMMQLMQAMPQAAPMIADLIAKNLDWPGADEIADRLKAMLPPQVQGMNPAVAQAQQQMQMMDAQAKQAVAQLQQQLQQATQAAQSKQADMQLKGQEIQIKGQEIAIKGQELAIKQQELAIKQFDAETKRMEAEAQAQEATGRLQLDAYTAQTAAQVPAAPIETKQEQQPINITIDGSRPVQKTAKATRQPDGSYVMESIEVPVQ